MVLQTLAAAEPAEQAGQLLGLLLMPGVGLLLLVLGLRRQHSPGRSGPVPPGVNPGPPPGYPPRGYPPPGYRPPGYPPPGPGYPSPPPGYPSPPARSGGTPLIVTGAVLLVLGLLGVAVAVTGRHAGPALAVGRCITNAQYAARYMHPKPVDCAAPDAVYELAAVGDGQMTCPDGRREHSAYALLVDDTTTYCFIANFIERHCYHADARTNNVAPVKCSDPQANMRIARRIDGSADADDCASGERAVTFPRPPRVFCVVSPGKPV